MQRTRAAASVHEWTRMTLTERAAWTAAGNLPPLAGGEPTPVEIAESELRSAFEALEAAQRAIADAADDASDEDVAALGQAFDEAEQEHARAAENVRRARAVQDARNALPVDPTAEPGGEGEGRDAGNLGGDARVTSEELVYRRDRMDSICLDAVAATCVRASQELGLDRAESVERLRRHRAQAHDHIQRMQRNDSGRLNEMRAAGLVIDQPASEQRDTGTDDAAAFIVPLYMLSDYVGVVRNRPVVADLIGRMSLPRGYGSIEIPKVVSGTEVDYHDEDLTDASPNAVHEVDADTDTVSTDIATIAGAQTVPVQLLQQTGVPVDQWLIPDLLAAYNHKLDQEVVNGTGNGSNKRIRGLLGVSGTTGVTYTSATPTAVGISTAAAKLLAALELAAPGYPPQVWLMAARRWYSQVAAVDDQGRLQTAFPTPNASFVNPMQSLQSLQEGLKGVFHGLPTVTSPTIPTTQGAGTNQDVIVSLRPQDILLWESERSLFASEHIKADTLRVYFRLHAFAAQIPDRLPAAQGRITGTGLVTPAFNQE